MEGSRYKYSPPEIPTGRKGLDTVLELVNQLLLESPAIASRQERLLTPDGVKPDYLEKIKALEEREKPLEELASFQALELAGVPLEFMRSQAYITTDETPYYFNIAGKEPNLHIDEEYLDVFSLADRPKKYEKAIRLGLIFMQANFNFLIQSSNLPNRLRGVIKPMFVRQLREKLFAEILKEKSFKTIPEDLEVAVDELNKVMAADEGPKKARFLRFGGRIFVVGPNRMISQAEYSMGQHFDVSVYLYLVHPLMKRFMDLVEKKYLAPYRSVSAGIYQIADQVKPRLARMSLLNRGELMEAYFNSTLPVILLDKDPSLPSRGYPY